MSLREGEYTGVGTSRKASRTALALNVGTTDPQPWGKAHGARDSAGVLKSGWFIKQCEGWPTGALPKLYGARCEVLEPAGWKRV